MFCLTNIVKLAGRLRKGGQAFDQLIYMANVRKPYVPRIGFPCFFSIDVLSGLKFLGVFSNIFYLFLERRGGGGKPVSAYDVSSLRVENFPPF